MRRGKLHEALSLLRVAIRHMRGWSVNRYLATVLHRLGYTREALAVVMRFRRTADKIDRADVDKLLGQWRADLAKRKRAPRHSRWRARHSR